MSCASGVIQTPRVDVVRIDPYVGPMAIVIITAEIISALFLVYFVVQTLRSMCKQKKDFLKVPI